MFTKDGHRTTVEAGCRALSRVCDLLRASAQSLWAQLRAQFRQ